MKKIGKIIKKNKMLLVGIIIVGIIFGGVVYASTVASSSVSYSNSSSGLSSTNVQGAIDELYEMSTTRINRLKHMYCGENIYNSLLSANHPCASDLKSSYDSCASKAGCSNSTECKNEAIKTYGSVSSYCQYNAISSKCSFATSSYNSCVNSKLGG